ncbi:MAG: DUF1150 family protein [Alphaproteobacteria bacterium]
MSEIEFASLGDGELAYIKTLRTHEAKIIYPQVEGLSELPGDVMIFAVHAADGTPLALTDTRFAALENVKENNLELVSLH